MTQADSQLIKWLRFPLTLGVVCLHCMGNVEIDWGALGTKDIPGLVKMTMSGCILQIAVPVFFFISGFLFFQGVKALDKNNPQSLNPSISQSLNLSISQYFRKKLQRRWYSLGIPYVLWILLSIPLTLLTIYGETLTGTSTMDDIHAYLNGLTIQSVFWGDVNPCSSPNLFGWTIYAAAPTLGSFWYVRDLIIVCLLSPVVYWLVVKTRYWGLAAVALIHVLRIWPVLSMGIQMLFFVYGAYWAINGWRLSFKSAIWRIAVYVLALILLVWLVSFEGDSTYPGFVLMPLFTIVGAAAILNLATQVIRHLPKAVNEKIMNLSKQSFFVYALHLEFALPLGFVITKKLFAVVPSGWFTATLQYLVTPCVIYVICMAIYTVMERLTPRLLAVLNGNRI